MPISTRKDVQLSSIIKEMQIKTTKMPTHPFRMTTIKNKEESVGEDVEKLELLCTVGGNVK